MLTITEDNPMAVAIGERSSTGPFPPLPDPVPSLAVTSYLIPYLWPCNPACATGVNLSPPAKNTPVVHIKAVGQRHLQPPTAAGSSGGMFWAGQSVKMD
jgi:hypothetical protein